MTLFVQVCKSCGLCDETYRGLSRSLADLSNVRVEYSSGSCLGACGLGKRVDLLHEGNVIRYASQSISRPSLIVKDVSDLAADVKKLST